MKNIQNSGENKDIPIIDGNKPVDFEEVHSCERRLTNNEIGHLQAIIKPIYDSVLEYGDMDKATKKIAEMFLKEQINLEYAYKAFENQTHNQETTNKIIDDAYSSPVPEGDIYPLHEILFNAGLDQKASKKIEDEIHLTLKESSSESRIIAKSGTDEEYINDTRKKQIIHKKINIKNDIDYSIEKIVINGCIKELTVYNSPLNSDPRRFKAIFEFNKQNRPLELGPSSIEEITMDLNDSGYVLSNRYVKDALPNIMNRFIECEKATIKDEIEYPGFFYDKENDKIITIEYELEEVTNSKLEGALEVLEEFAAYFKGNRVKVAHIFKWGLMSPFFFVVKQKGRWIPHLYLYGKARSGKTTLADMNLYLWNTPDSASNDISGSGFNTEARIGEKLKRFTFPIVVNEPQGVFDKPGNVEMIKSSIERTDSRGKFDGRGYKTVLSLAPVIYTSNHTLPNDDALIRRLDCLSFTYSERKSDEEIEEFITKFNMENRDQCKLHDLKPLAHWFADQIIGDPSLLGLGWKELTNQLIARACACIDKETPRWLLKWSKTETLEDMDDHQIETIRVFLSSEINRAARNIQIIDGESGYPKKEGLDGYSTDKSGNIINVKDINDFKSNTWNVINYRRIPWLYATKRGNVILTQGFIDALKKETGIYETLKSISELLSWEYAKRRVKGENRKERSVLVGFNTFLRFLYPSFD